MDPPNKFSISRLSCIAGQMGGLNHSFSSPPVLIGMSGHTSQEPMSPDSMSISHLMNLPTEILIQIVDQCDVWTLTDLRQANSFFCRICTSKVLYNATKDSLNDRIALLFYAALTKEMSLALKILRNLRTIEIDFTGDSGKFNGPTKPALSSSIAESKLSYVMQHDLTLLLRKPQGAQMYTALAWAAEYNIIPFMKLLFNRDPSCVNDIDNLGRTPLSVAIINTRESWGETLLLEYGANPNAHDVPTLYHAVVNTNISTDFLAMLISKGATPDLAIQERGKWWTPLHAAAVHRDEAVVNMILNCGVDVDPVLGDRGRSSTPLHLASLRKGGGLIVKTLIEAGADWTLKNEHGKNVFESMEGSKNPAIVHLISGMYQSGQEPPDKRTYTHLAIQYGAMEVLNSCITRRENLETEDGDGHRPLYTAITFRKIEALMLLVEAGADQGYLMEKHGTSLLHFAATIPGLEFYRYLLNKGSRYPFSLNRDRQSAISIASWVDIRPISSWVDIRPIASRVEIRPKDPRKDPRKKVRSLRYRDGEEDIRLTKMASEKQRELMKEAIEIGKRLGTIWDVSSGYQGSDEDDEIGGT